MSVLSFRHMVFLGFFRRVAETRRELPGLAGVGRVFGRRLLFALQLRLQPVQFNLFVLDLPFLLLGASQKKNA